MHAGYQYILRTGYTYCNFLTLFHISSVVDSDSLNPDTDPHTAFQVNLYPYADVGFNDQKLKKNKLNFFFFFHQKLLFTYP
jgi:hypothetical protein